MEGEEGERAGRSHTPRAAIDWCAVIVGGGSVVVGVVGVHVGGVGLSDRGTTLIWQAQGARPRDAHDRC